MNEDRKATTHDVQELLDIAPMSHAMAAEVFRRTFGLNLAPYWNQFGFDVIKFDEWVQPPDGRSCAEVVRERYGKDAEAFILILIKLRSPVLSVYAQRAKQSEVFLAAKGLTWEQFKALPARRQKKLNDEFKKGAQ